MEHERGRSVPASAKHVSFVRLALAKISAIVSRVGSIAIVSSYVVFGMLRAALGDDVSRGEIRLLAPLSSVPTSIAIVPDPRSILVSELDGSVASFDPNSSDTSSRQVLLSAPIRDEEFQRQHPIALSPSAEIIALGAPAEKNKANSARIYIFRRSDPSRVIYTLDSLPSRPTALAFARDSYGTGILLAAVFAEGQLARIWNVTKIVDAARDLTVDPTAPPVVNLPAPTANFFSDCGRSECHSWAVAFPPDSSSPIGLVVGADSGLIVYDRKFAVTGYGTWRDSDLRRIASVAFSPDGKRIAVGKYALDKPEDSPDFACSVDVYGSEAMINVDGDRRIKATPLRLSPSQPHEGMNRCTLAHVAWTDAALFAAGEYVRSPPLDQKCRTFQNLEQNYDPYANVMLRWQSTDGAPTATCIGTNSAIDIRPFGDGGVVIATQDPAIGIYDAEGKLSHYPDSPETTRLIPGPVLDLRDAERGQLTVNDDATLVFFHPLAVPRVYVGFDLRPPLPLKPVEAIRNEDIDAAHAAILKQLSAHRDAPVNFTRRTAQPDNCLGLDVVSELTQQALRELTRAIKEPLKLRPSEVVRSVEFLPPENGEPNWRVVIGTSHRLLYLGCDARDWFHNGQNIYELAFPGVPVRGEAYQVRVSGNKRFVVVAHADGMLRWYRMASGQNILSVFISRNLKSWVAWSADGYFDHSDDVGGQIAGWLQSTTDGNGIWTITTEPLTQHEKKWRKPSALRGWITGSVNDAVDVPVPTKAPGSNRPALTLQVLNGDKLTDPVVKLRVRIDNFAGALTASSVIITVQGMGTVGLTGSPAWQQGNDAGIEGSFALNECLRKKGQTIRIWAQFSDRAVEADPTIAAVNSGARVVYDGEPSGAWCAPGRVWAVAIGISGYDKDPLKYADQDAERFVAFWRNQRFYDIGRIAVLKAPSGGNAAKIVYGPEGPMNTEAIPKADSKTVRKMLRDEIEAIQSKIKPTDLLMFYFVGHGMSFLNSDREHFYFLPSDADTASQDSLGRTAIDANWLRGPLGDLNRQVPIVIFIDACRTSQNVYVGDLPNDLDFNTALGEFNATVVLATGPGARAFEFPQHDLDHPKNPIQCEVSEPQEQEGGGAFTYALLRVLGHSDDRANLPRDGSIPLLKLLSAVEDSTKRICDMQHVRHGKVSLYFPGFFLKH